MESYKSSDYEKYLEEVRKSVNQIKYGSITLIVQDGKVIQIDKTEKVIVTDRKDRRFHQNP